ncbi:MAG: hypothetical protein VX899_14965 [Myxococcota bacterium]|nr:hypothetical protein [Myxococcota bacterium]
MAPVAGRLHRKLLLSALSTLLLLGAVEVTLRLIQPAQRPDHGIEMQPHPTRIWSLTPGQHSAYGSSFKVGADGLRAGIAEPRGQLPRVLTLGDSSIFGHGVADGETLHDALQRALHEQGLPAEVHCGGVPGYSILQSRLLLQEVGWALDPDVLVVGNQFSDMAPEDFPDEVVLERLASPTVRFDRLLSHLALFRTLKAGIASAKGVPAYAAVGWPTPQSLGAPRVPPETYLRELEGVLVEARERGVGVVFLRLSNREDYELGKQGGYGVLMEALAEAWSVPLVQADPVLRASGLSAQALFLDEVHPNAAADKLLADALVRALADSGFPQTLPLPAAAPSRSVQVPAEGFPYSPMMESQIAPYVDGR